MFRLLIRPAPEALWTSSKSFQKKWCCSQKWKFSRFFFRRNLVFSLSARTISWTFQLLLLAQGKSDVASCASNLNICRSELERQNSEDTALRNELDSLRPTLTSLQHLGVVEFCSSRCFAQVPTGLIEVDSIKFLFGVWGGFRFWPTGMISEEPNFLHLVHGNVSGFKQMSRATLGHVGKFRQDPRLFGCQLCPSMSLFQNMQPSVRPKQLATSQTLNAPLQRHPASQLPVYFKHYA